MQIFSENVISLHNHVTNTCASREEGSSKLILNVSTNAQIEFIYTVTSPRQQVDFESS